MDKLTCMKAFVAVVNAGGFSKAERKTRISKSLLSKYVSQLEEHLNVRLLQRTTRHVSITPAGGEFFDRCSALLKDFEELETYTLELNKGLSGELLISAPTSFAEIYMAPVVQRYSQKFPDVKIRLLLTDRFVDLIEEGVNLAIRIGDLPDSSLIAKRLGDVEILPCASPAYLEHYPAPKTAADLAHHRCVVDSNFRGGPRWSFVEDGENVTISVNGTYEVNSALAARALILKGGGIGLCPSFVVGNDIKEGRLVRVLNNCEQKTFGLYIVYPHRRHLSQKVRLFIEEVQAHFSDHPEWNSEHAPFEV